MCQHHSESGKPCGFTPCAEYAVLKSERDRLQGVVQGMTEQGERNAKDLRSHNQRLVEVTKERDALLKIVEKADAIINASKKPPIPMPNTYLYEALEAYRKARHG